MFVAPFKPVPVADKYVAYYESVFSTYDKPPLLQQPFYAPLDFVRDYPGEPVSKR